MSAHDDLPITYPTFDRKEDNVCKYVATTWGAFCADFSTHVVTPKKNIKLWSPAMFKPGTPRRSENVVSVGFAVADIDSKKQNVTTKHLADLIEQFRAFEFFFHTSHSHDPAADKCCARFIFPLAKPFTAFSGERQRHSTRAWDEAWLNFSRFFVSVAIDGQCRNPNRVYYIPSCPPLGAEEALTHRNEGRLLSFEELATARKPASETNRTSTAALTDKERERLIGKMKKAKLELAFAFDKMLKGESFAGDGERDDTLLKMCGALVSKGWAPDTSPEVIADFFDASLAAMASESTDPNNPPPTRETVIEKLTRLQLKEQSKEADKKAELQVETTERSAGKIRRLTNGARSTPYTLEEIEVFAKEQKAGSAQDFLDSRLVLQKGSAYYVWCNDGYPVEPQPWGSAEAAAKKWLPIMPVSLHRTGANGQWIALGIGDMVDRYGDIIHKVTSDLSLQKSYFDPVTKIFYEAVTPLRKDLAPEFDQDVHTWLQLLGAQVVDWMAAVTRLERMCGALIVIGTEGIGKGVLARGASTCWNTSGTPADLERILDDFTEDLVAFAPVIHVDESLPYAKGRDLSAKIRAIIGSQSRALRRKYISPTELIGAPRLLMTANNPSIMNFRKAELTREDTEAVAKRFVSVNPDCEPIQRYLAPFQARGEIEGSWIKEWRIARHILWLRENHKLDETQRFLVMGKEESVHRHLLTQGEIENAICEWLVGYLQDPPKIESASGSFIERDLKTQNLWINVAAITSTWSTFIKAERQPTTTAVGRVLRNLAFEKKYRWRGGRQTNMYRLDLRHVFDWIARVGHGDAGLIRENLGMAKADKEDKAADDGVEAESTNRAPVGSPSNGSFGHSSLDEMSSVSEDVGSNPAPVDPSSPFYAFTAFEPTAPVEAGPSPEAAAFWELPTAFQEEINEVASEEWVVP